MSTEKADCLPFRQESHMFRRLQGNAVQVRRVSRCLTATGLLLTPVPLRAFVPMVHFLWSGKRVQTKSQPFTSSPLVLSLSPKRGGLLCLASGFARAGFSLSPFRSCHEPGAPAQVLPCSKGALFLPTGPPHFGWRLQRKGLLDVISMMLWTLWCVCKPANGSDTRDHWKGCRLSRQMGEERSSVYPPPRARGPASLRFA